jgi:HK97 family phage major capsid protein
MTIHSANLTRAAATLLASGATFHVKDAGDPIETLRKAFGDHNTEVLRRLGASDQTLNELGQRLFDIEQKSVRGGPFTPDLPETWGRQVGRAEEVKSLHSNFKGRVRIDVKATVTSATADALGSAGDLVTPDRRPGVIELPRRKLRLRQLFAPGETSSNAVQWPKMKVRTNNAATAAENTFKPQSDLQFELKTWPVVTIAHWMIASRQILDDAPALSSIIDSELRFGVADVEDQQLLNGSGTGSDLTGVYTGATAYSAPFQPTEAGNLNKIDILLLAIAQCDALNFETDGIVLHPLDWRDIQLTKDSVGRYVGSGPFADLLARLWQMPVVTTTSMTVGNFLVGAFRQGAQIFDRQEATVEISTEDSDNFRKNLVTLLGEERLAFVVKNPDAFIKGNFVAALAAS